MPEKPTIAPPNPEPEARQTKLGIGGGFSSGYVSKKREGKVLADTTLHLGYPADEARSSLQKAIRRGDERSACWWAFQFIRHGWTRYLQTTLRIVAVEDVGVASPETLIAVDAVLAHGEKGTDGFKKAAFVGMAEMTAVVLLSRAPKCHSGVNALLTCAKLWLQVERGEAEPPPIPAYAIDNHTRRGRAMKVPKAAWWAESKVLQPKGTTHAANGGDPFAAIEGDTEVLEG